MAKTKNIRISAYCERVFLKLVEIYGGRVKRGWLVGEAWRKILEYERQHGAIDFYTFTEGYVKRGLGIESFKERVTTSPKSFTFGADAEEGIKSIQQIAKADSRFGLERSLRETYAITILVSALLSIKEGHRLPLLKDGDC